MRTGMRGGMHSGDDPTHGFPARFPTLRRGTTLTHSFRAAVTALRLDPGQLSIRDRVVLRILNRARLVNAQQLGALVYHRRRHTQARLRRLWDLGYLERSGLAPPSGIRGSPYAHRVAQNLSAWVAPGPTASPALFVHGRAADPRADRVTGSQGEPREAGVRHGPCGPSAPSPPGRFGRSTVPAAVDTCHPSCLRFRRRLRGPCGPGPSRWRAAHDCHRPYPRARDPRLPR